MGMTSAKAQPWIPPGRAGALRRSVADAEAFHEFYVANRRGVLRFLSRRLMDADAARDLAAETFVVALQRREQFRGGTDAEAEAWLFRIARSQLLDHWRRGAAERRALEQLGGVRPPADVIEIERIEERDGLDDLCGHVRRAIARLPRDQAYAVQQRVVFEREYEDLAAELGISEVAVRARVSRGLRTLATTTTHPPARAA